MQPTDNNNTSITPQQIEAWEKQYGEIEKITLLAVVVGGEVKHEERSFFLKKPLRNVIKLAYSKRFTLEGTYDAVSPGEVILKNCKIGGDDVETEDVYFFRACEACNGFLMRGLGN